MTDTKELPTLRFTLGSTVTPGDRLGTIRQILPGSGTYLKGGVVCASVVGKLQVEPRGDDNKLVATVKLHDPNKQLTTSQVLSVGNIVMAKVVRITNQQAMLDIVAIQGVSGILRHHHEGAIRREDIRTGASEQVQIQDCMLPGDIVLCRVLALGDTRRYLLTTAEPSLGVIYAVSATSGKPMVPCSYKEMECPETKVKEPRKCARPRDLSADLQPEESG